MTVIAVAIAYGVPKFGIDCEGRLLILVAEGAFVAQSLQWKSAEALSNLAAIA
jgi:hypothetical protein